jgi:fucose permease
MTVFGVWIATLPIPAPRAHPHLGGVRDGLRDALRTPEVWYVGCVALLMGPLDESFLAFLIAKLQRVDGLSLGLATLVAMFTIVGTGIGFAAAPRLRAPSLVRAAAQLTVGAAVCGLSPWLPVTIAAALCFGFALARGWMAVKLQAIDIRPERRGTVSAVVSTIEFTGFVLPLLAGVVADAHGLTAGLACYVLIAFALFALALTYANRARAI